MGKNTWVNISINSKDYELLLEFLIDIDIYEFKGLLNEICYDEDDKKYIYIYEGELYRGHKCKEFIKEKIKEYGENIEVYFGLVDIENIEMEKI